MDDDDRADVANELADRFRDDPEAGKRFTLTEDGRAAIAKLQSALTAEGEDARPELQQALDGANDPAFREKASSREVLRKEQAITLYREKGDQSFDLSDPAFRNQLIEPSPQRDDLQSTETDEVRCSDAALLNGMLLDGDHAKSTAAIEEPPTTSTSS